MSKIRDFVKKETEGWRLWEVLWLFLACAVITGLSIYWKDSAMGIVSATTGVACVVCTGKGKLSAYIFGLINCILYAIISFEAKLYGETMLNAIYYVPMQFYGFYIWSKNINDDTKEVKKRCMSNKGRVLLFLSIVASTVSYGFVLKEAHPVFPLEPFWRVCGTSTWNLTGTSLLTWKISPFIVCLAPRGSLRVCWRSIGLAFCFYQVVFLWL